MNVSIQVYLRNPAVWTIFQVLSIGELRKGEKNGKKEKNISGHPQKKQYVNNFGSDLGKKKGFPKLNRSWLHLRLKEGMLKFAKGSPPAICRIESSRWQRYRVHPYSMHGFLQLITDLWILHLIIKLHGCTLEQIRNIDMNMPHKTWKAVT